MEATAACGSTANRSIMLPLLVLRFVPSEWLQERRLLELALLVYLIGLVIGLRVYPKIASKVVGVAAVARRILVDRTKLGGCFSPPSLDCRANNCFSRIPRSRTRLQVARC